MSSQRVWLQAKDGAICTMTGVKADQARSGANRGAWTRLRTSMPASGAGQAADVWSGTWLARSHQAARAAAVGALAALRAAHVHVWPLHRGLPPPRTPRLADLPALTKSAA